MNPRRPTISERAPFARFLVLALAAMGITTAALVVVVVRVAGTLRRSTADISLNAVPSMIALADARSELRRAQGALVHALAGGTAENPEIAATIEGARHALDADLERYHALPTFPGEVELWPELRDARARFEALADRILRRGPPPGAPRVADVLAREVWDAGDELDVTLARIIRLNGAVTERLAAGIGTVRREALPVVIALSVVDFVVVSAAIAAAYRVIRNALDREYAAQRELEARADELEAFSGRVAHDLLSPLMTVAVALNIAEQRLGEAENDRTRLTLVRAQHSLESVRQLVDGLLQFARAGARPRPGERTEACAILRGVVEDFLPTAREAGVDLELVAECPAVVACGPGVLISIVSNLVQNAIKALADSEVRRITVRVAREPSVARVGVEDTGPGVATERQHAIFEPHVRGPHGGRSGFGLGLATVKRLALACGGEVGLVSEPGNGATFWFTLPLARGTSSS